MLLYQEATFRIILRYPPTVPQPTIPSLFDGTRVARLPPEEDAILVAGPGEIVVAARPAKTLKLNRPEAFRLGTEERSPRRPLCQEGPGLSHQPVVRHLVDCRSSPREGVPPEGLRGKQASSRTAGTPGAGERRWRAGGPQIKPNRMESYVIKGMTIGVGAGYGEQSEGWGGMASREQVCLWGTARMASLSAGSTPAAYQSKFAKTAMAPGGGRAPG